MRKNKGQSVTNAVGYLMRDHVAIANKYIDDILTGEIPACQYVKWACERQRNDLLDPPEGYTFSDYAANRVCAFIELLPHIKGKWARGGNKIDLMPFYVFILTTVFGWVDKSNNRRFKTVYIEVPRKSAKSTVSSGVALYCLAADDEPGAEVYTAATNRIQAKIVWDDAHRMVERTKGLRDRFGVKTSAHAIYIEENASSMKALSRDMGGNLDGLSTHCAIIDEIHGHKNRYLWDVIDSSTMARESPLLWGITTAGFNKAGICYELRSDLIKVIDPHNEIKDDSYFGIIYTIDDDDDWKEESSWIKANPAWGHSTSPDDIRRKAAKAMRTASAQNNFLTKYLCVWTNANTTWMNSVEWSKAGDATLNESDFSEEELWLGADLATKTDIASTVRLYRKDGIFYCFGSHYLNEDKIFESDNSQYQGWAIDGHITETPGNTTDYEIIEDDIIEATKIKAFKEIGFDPHQASYLMQRLIAQNINVIEVPQNQKTLSEPMKMLEALVLEGRLKHDDNPVMNWMMSNVVAHTNAKGYIYPRKESEANKIDGVVALIIALGRALIEDSHKSIYETEERGIQFF